MSELLTRLQKASKQQTKWNWTEKMESYQRPFLEPTNSYMRNLCENNPNFLLDRGSRTTDMSDLWLSLKPDEINPEIITTDELYEIHRVCYEHESKQFLDPKYLKAGDDVQKASRIRAQILPHLNKKENEQLKRLDSARDALCQKISTVVNWKELIYRIYCKDVTEMVQPGTTAEIPITLEDVCTLLSEGLLPMIGGRHKLEDSSLERDSDEKTPATGQAPTHTMDAERRQLVGNIAKAYARVLTTTDVPLNEYYLTNLHYTLFEKTEQAKDGGAIGHGKYDKLNEGVTWIGEQMKGSEVDKVTLAAMGALTAFVVHPFADGNTQVSQLFQTSILVRAGYPPSRTEVIEFEKCVTEFTNKSRDPRHFVRHMINSLEHTIVEWNNLIEHVRAHPESVLTGHSMSSFPLLKKSTSTTTLNDSISSETLGESSSQHEWDQSGSTPKAAFQLTHKAEMSPSPAVVGQVAPEEAMPTTFAGLFEAAIREYCPQLLENGPSENLTGIPWMFKEALSEYAPHLLRF